MVINFIILSFLQGFKGQFNLFGVIYHFLSFPINLHPILSSFAAFLIGTIYGDMACAINPLGDLYKTQVWDLAREIGVPEEIIEKIPSADLWQGQTDEGELGFQYSEVDRLLNLMIDNELSRGELIRKGFQEDFIERVMARIRSSEYKRRMPIVPLRG